MLIRVVGKIVYYTFWLMVAAALIAVWFDSTLGNTIAGIALIYGYVVILLVVIGPPFSPRKH
jgi:hypothetical protein